LVSLWTVVISSINSLDCSLTRTIVPITPVTQLISFYITYLLHALGPEYMQQKGKVSQTTN